MDTCYRKINVLTVQKSCNFVKRKKNDSDLVKGGHMKKFLEKLFLKHAKVVSKDFWFKEEKPTNVITFFALVEQWIFLHRKRHL